MLAVAAIKPLLPVRGAFSAEPADLTSWAMNAISGDRCIYARVVSLTRGGIGERARVLAGSGVIELRRCRNDHDGTLFDYIALRSARPFVDPAGIGGRLTIDDRRMLELLSRVADAGAPCPSDAAMAAILGIKTASAASSRLHRLRQMGRVMVLSSAREPGRIITIISSGASTGVSR